MFIRNQYLIKNSNFGTTDCCNKKKKKITKLTLQIYVKISPFFPSLKKIWIPPPLKKQRKKGGKPSSLSKFQCLGSVGDIDEL